MNLEIACQSSPDAKPCGLVFEGHSAFLRTVEDGRRGTGLTLDMPSTRPMQRVDTGQRIQSWTYSTDSCIDLLMLCTSEIYLGISAYTLSVPS